MTVHSRDFVWAIVVVLAGLTTGLLAQQRAPVGEFRVYGEGTVSCGKWTEERRKDSLLSSAYFSWALGFVSGFGYGNERPVRMRLTDSDAIRAYIDNYCQTHPLDSLSKAGGALVEELLK